MKFKRGEQAALARQLGITPRHMSNILNGRSTPSPKLAERLEAQLGVSAAAWLWPQKYGNPYVQAKKS